jgi:hypothetical protein
MQRQRGRNSPVATASVQQAGERPTFIDVAIARHTVTRQILVRNNDQCKSSLPRLACRREKRCEHPDIANVAS